MSEFIGRKVSVGLGLETTPGTAVAPTIWPKQTKFSFQSKTNVAMNESAMGRVEKANDSAVVEQWAEGDLEGKVYDQSVGYLLSNMFGAAVSTDNADTNPVVKDHTFDIAQGTTAKTLTVVRIDGNDNKRHANGTLESLEFTFEQNNWVMVSGSLQALVGATGSDTTAYAAENPFTSKHVVAKIATNVAGLGSATALEVKSGRLTISRELNRFTPMGAIDPSAFNIGAVTAEGELVLKYSSTALKTLWLANTQQALSMTFANTDTTIGAAAHPGLVFTMPKVRLATLELSDDLDTVIEQTVAFRAEFDLSSSYMIRAVLTNALASY